LNNWSKVAIHLSDTLEIAIKVLHSGGLRVALVVDERGKLLGTITDGDIRRALINHLDMGCPVLKVMNSNPLSALSTDSEAAILENMKSKDILHMPIVDQNGILVGLKTLQNLTFNQKLDNAVFIMAGGFGTRLQPLTNETPKPLLNIGSRPILETILRRFINAGFYNFYISTHYKAEKVISYFGDGSSYGVNIQYINEDTPLGTAGAIGLLPKDIPSKPIIMMNGDVLTKVNFSDLLNFHYEHDGIATMCIREYDVQIPFGVVNIENHKIKNIIEKPLKKFFINTGIYVFNPSLIDNVNPNVHIDMPELLEKQIEEGKSINVFPIHEYWQDIGHIEEYENANEEFINGFSLDD
jgi:dTDP-glucose pyrophosphorylase